MKKAVIGGFLMGALAVGVFHQGTLFLLFHYGNHIPAVTEVFGRVGSPGWNLGQLMTHPPVPGLPIPQFVSAMFWGGLWGILIALVLRYTPLPDLLTGLLIGAVGCTLVAVTLVASLKGLPAMAGGDTRALLRGALINGAFGWGAAFLMRPLEVRGGGALTMRHANAPR